MKVFLVRHSRAVEAPSGLPDECRWLSREGRRLVRAVGRRLREEGVWLDAVLTSPLVRAVETAELLAEGVDYTDEVEALPALAPGAEPRVIAEILPARGVSVAVVGHAPDLSALGAFLVSRPSFPPLRPAQVMLLERGLPVWSLSPDTLALERLLVA